MLRSAIILEINKFLLINSFKNTCKITVLYYNCKSHQFHSFSKRIPCCKNKYSVVNNIKYSQSSDSILYDVLKLRDKDTSNTIIDSYVNELCTYYKCLSREQKQDFIIKLACNYSVCNKDVCTLATTLVGDNCNETQSIRLQEKLKTALTPKYKWLFVHIGRQENGVKFLVDMRTDVLDVIREINKSEDSSLAYIQQLNHTLRELFLLWFSVGFLNLERVTWGSSCEMLEKIADYEAVHPVRNWTDLKKRMGVDRRCFVYTHSSMPEEPLVILHTALRQEIATSTSSIITYNSNNEEVQMQRDQYHPDKVTAAIFYSISSSQVGLQGIELGNYLIKRVATELAKEFPKLIVFSSLSPIPNFKTWLFCVLKRAKDDSDIANEYFTKEELASLAKILNNDDVFNDLMKKLNGNNWLNIPNLVKILEPILMRSCVRYLYLEKKRGYALDGVANFHLRNGAEMWRINWMADLSARGLSSSCGIMVNYRYYLDEAENNSKLYIENKEIVISPLVEELLKIHKLC